MSKKPAVTKPGCLFFDQKTIHHLSRGIKIKSFQLDPSFKQSTQENVSQNEQKHSDICIRDDGDHRRSRIRARGAVFLQLRQWRGNMRLFCGVLSLSLCLRCEYIPDLIS